MYTNGKSLQNLGITKHEQVRNKMVLGNFRRYLNTTRYMHGHVCYKAARRELHKPCIKKK